MIHNDMPTAIATLKLAPGETSSRKVMHCQDCMSFHTAPAEDLEESISSVIFEATIVWDPVTKRDIIDAESARAICCVTCGNENCEEIDFTFSNMKAVTSAYSNLVMLSLTHERYGPQNPQREAEEEEAEEFILCCNHCGSESISFNGYTHLAPTTGQMIFRRHTAAKACHSCGTNTLRPQEGDVSAHRRIEIEKERIRISKDAALDAQALITWLRANGQAYGISTAQIDQLESVRDELTAELMDQD